jgi:hypothetical protein
MVTLLFIEHDGIRYKCKAEITRESDSARFVRAEVTVSSPDDDAVGTVEVLPDAPCNITPGSRLLDAVANQIRDDMIVPQRPLLRDCNPQSFGTIIEETARRLGTVSNSLWVAAPQLAAWALGEITGLSPEEALDAADVVAKACGHESADRVGLDGAGIVIAAACGRAKLRRGEDIAVTQLAALCTLRAGATYPRAAGPIPRSVAVEHLQKMRIPV